MSKIACERVTEMVGGNETSMGQCESVRKTCGHEWSVWGKASQPVVEFSILPTNIKHSAVSVTNAPTTLQKQNAEDYQAVDCDYCFTMDLNAKLRKTEIWDHDFSDSSLSSLGFNIKKSVYLFIITWEIWQPDHTVPKDAAWLLTTLFMVLIDFTVWASRSRATWSRMRAGLKSSTWKDRSGCHLSLDRPWVMRCSLYVKQFSVQIQLIGFML